MNFQNSSENFNKLSLKASTLFSIKPPRWGLRGDPFLWQEMKDHFHNICIPESVEILIMLVEEAFHKLTGHELREDKDFYVEKYSHGGMSSGFVSPLFWRSKIVPVLSKRLSEIAHFPSDQQLPTLKILSWNCHQKSFEQYMSYCEEYDADIIVIQECLKPPDGTPNCIWIGKDPNKKGVAVISREGYEIKALFLENDLPTYYLPVTVKGPLNFNLMAVWTQSASPRYIQGAHKIIDNIQDSFLDQYSSDMIIVGDFNSNAIWDRLHGKFNHSAFVNRLKNNHNMASTYHYFYKEEHGKENVPTHLWRYSKPFHIDYCFAPLEWCERIVSVKIGDFNIWRERSDHAPIVTEFAWFPWQDISDEGSIFYTT